jgi:glucose/arabinose dehydrogenase
MVPEGIRVGRLGAMGLPLRTRSVTIAAAGLTLFAAAAGCGNDEPPAAEDRPEPTVEQPGPTVEQPNVEVQAVRVDLDVDTPMAVVAVPGTSSLLLAERSGRILEVVTDGDDLALAEDPVVLDLRERIGSTEAERGLLGLAVDPEGEHVYASYTGADRGESLVDEFTLGGRAGSLSADGDSRRNLVEVEQPFANHNGGHIEFGPDGLLYLGLGDGGAADDPNGAAQDPSTLLGKLVQLDPSASEPLTDKNPYASGLRNPWRFSFDPDTGDLWVADVGQNRFEEINRVTAADGGAEGVNFGWDLFEGTEEFEAADPAPGGASDGPFVEPVFTYGRDEGCSVTGGVVYRGSALTGLEGAYLYSDYCTPGVRALLADEDGRLGSVDVTDAPGSVVSFGQDANGEILVLSLEDGVFRLTAS